MSAGHYYLTLYGYRLGIPHGGSYGKICLATHPERPECCPPRCISLVLLRPTLRPCYGAAWDRLTFLVLIRKCQASTLSTKPLGMCRTGCCGIVISSLWEGIAEIGSGCP